MRIMRLSNGGRDGPGVVYEAPPSPTASHASVCDSMYQLEVGSLASYRMQEDERSIVSIGYVHAYILLVLWRGENGLSFVWTCHLSYFERGAFLFGGRSCFISFVDC